MRHRCARYSENENGIRNRTDTASWLTMHWVLFQYYYTKIWIISVRVVCKLHSPTMCNCQLCRIENYPFDSATRIDLNRFFHLYSATGRMHLIPATGVHRVPTTKLSTRAIELIARHYEKTSNLSGARSVLVGSRGWRDRLGRLCAFTGSAPPCG